VRSLLGRTFSNNVSQLLRDRFDVVGSLGFAPRSSGDVTRKAPSFSIFWFWLHTDYVGALRKGIRDVCEPSSRESSL
jgi:hypothetical protein